MIIGMLMFSASQQCVVHSGPDQINQACRRIQRSQAEEADEEAEEDVKDVDSPDGGERQPTTMRRRTEEVWCMRCYLEI